MILQTEDFVITETETIKFTFQKGKFDKSFSDFLKMYPDYVTNAVTLGTSAIANYKTAKNATARFFAKSQFEKKLYSDVVNTLNSSGKFRLVTKKVKDGGIFYELVRT